jgi:hypothetical protein
MPGVEAAESGQPDSQGVAKPPGVSARDLAARARGRRELRFLRASPQHRRVAEVPVPRLLGRGPRKHRVRRERALRPLLGQLAQPRRLVDRVTDHRVLQTALGADVARHDRTRRDPDARIELRKLLPQALPDRAPGGQRGSCVV